MRVLFHYGLTVGLGLHFFTTYSLVYIIVIERTNTVFLRLVIEIKLLVFISILLYLFLQQLLMEIILLNKVHYMAR